MALDGDDPGGDLPCWPVSNGGSGVRIEPVFHFDLDVSLVDSVYQQVLYWRVELAAEGIVL
jgi:hypothetical protein